MSAIEPGLPAFSVIERALRVTTDRLAREIVTPTDTPPEWSPFEWDMARAAATMQGCAGLLAGTGHWRGVEGWRRFLDDQHAQIAAIQDKARQLLERIDDATRRAGIPCVALKGSALLALGLLGRGARSMGDVDLLVRPADTDAIADALHSLGYRTGHWSRRHLTYYPAHTGQSLVIGEHRDNPMRIEVHPRISEELPLSQVDITSTIWPADARPGINRYASLAGLMRHNLLHAAGNMRARALRLVQLHDIASLAGLLGPEDWRELLAHRRQADDGWWLYPPLAFAQRYVPGAIPIEVLESARAACPRLLRWRTARQDLYQVSWSNPRIAALPGIEWARTPLEAARFARSRVFPSKVALREIEDGANNQPGLLSVPWYQISHFQRILRWIRSRPLRVHTLIQVRAAAGLGVPGLNRIA